MKYQGCLLAVRDMSASKHFYKEVLHQNLVMDMGEHAAFEGFSLQQGYAELIKRFFRQGMAAEEVAARTMYPIEVVKQYEL